MATTIEPKSGVLSKTQTPKEEEMVKTAGYGEKGKERVNCETGTEVAKLPNNEKVEEKNEANGNEEKKEVAVEVEPKSGISFPVKLEDGKQLYSVGVRKKTVFGMSVMVYGFAIYADNEKLKSLLRSKIGKAQSKPSKELYQAVIDSDLEMTVKLKPAHPLLTMPIMKKGFGESMTAAIKKLKGGRKNEELALKIMGGASDNIKLTTASVIEVAKLQGYILQTKVMGEMVSKVESEVLCRAYISMYLGADSVDKDAKEKFGMSMLSLF